MKACIVNLGLIVVLKTNWKKGKKVESVWRYSSGLCDSCPIQV